MKNKFTSLILLICITLCLPVTSYAVNNQETEINLFKVSGRGTEANPFRITNEEELLLLADFPECYFELENDVEFTGTWEPIADFSGSFDGKGHTITVSDYMLKTNMGFFGTLSGIVKNLTINANYSPKPIRPNACQKYTPLIICKIQKQAKPKQCAQTNTLCAQTHIFNRNNTLSLHKGNQMEIWKI